MSHDATVNAGDIARLVDVGRAAVSNWRRRYEDFPRPVGGTASSPLFSLREVEDWLRRNGKSFRVSLADRTWQRLRTAGDDLELGRLVADAGAFLLRHQREADPNRNKNGTEDLPAPTGEPPVDEELLVGLADERGHAFAFEFLYNRYLRAHSRRLAVTPVPTAELMTRLVHNGEGTLFDPACGFGTLLLSAPASRALGQELTGTGATIAALRLRLRGIPAGIVAGDSLREDGFATELADTVVCDPPFNERAWGHADLTGDARWEYGLPPRGESELAWVQHCLAHVKPGGYVAILMPTVVAGRRPGKRIRGNLLRAGALRAVITLEAGEPDLWLLRRPKPGERPPSHLLLLDAQGDEERIERAWFYSQHDPDADSPHTVRIIDLLDDDIDLSPAAQRSPLGGRDFGREYAETLDRLRAAIPEPPRLDVVPDPATPPVTTIGELVKTGQLGIRHAPARGTGPDPVEVAPGDVVAAPTGEAVVITEKGTLEPPLTRYRPDPGRLDPEFLAGILRFAAPRTQAGSSRIDARRTQLPRLPLDEQRRYGSAFRELVTMEANLRETAALGEKLIRLGFGGLLDGHLRPDG
jgi:hypothetical protein